MSSLWFVATKHQIHTPVSPSWERARACPVLDTGVRVYGIGLALPQFADAEDAGDGEAADEEDEGQGDHGEDDEHDRVGDE